MVNCNIVAFTWRVLNCFARWCSTGTGGTPGTLWNAFSLVINKLGFSKNKFRETP
jgi:hypothetical protein